MSRIAEFRRRWSLPGTEMPPASRGSDQPEESGVSPEDNSCYDVIGRCSAWVVVPLLDAAVASACLIPHVELAPPAGTPPGKHPAVWCFGFHRGVRPRCTSHWQYDYDETLIGLPHVALRRSDGSLSGPYFQMTSLRLDSQFADQLGVALGFPKKMAILDVTNTTYSIRMKPDADPVMAGTFRGCGPIFGPDFPNFQTIEQMMLQQPVISKAPSGSYLLTQFQVDKQSAVMFPAVAAFTVADDSMAGLPKGDYQFPGIDVTAFGGCYHSVHDWSMSQPVPIVV